MNWKGFGRSEKPVCNHLLMLVPLADFSTLKMEAICSSETSVHTNLHGATSQKTVYFTVTAVKTSNLTRIYNLRLLLYRWYKNRIKHSKIAIRFF
jgi:hypothetical protein